MTTTTRPGSTDNDDTNIRHRPDENDNEHETFNRMFKRQNLTPPSAAKILSALRKAREDGFDLDTLNNDQDRVKLIFLYFNIPWTSYI